MDHHLDEILTTISESAGDIDDQINKLQQMINDKGFNSVSSSVLDRLVVILDECIKKNEDKLKISQTKEVSPNSFISDLFDNYASCSRYELELHKIVYLMIEIVTKCNSSLTWSESSSKILISLIKNLKLYIRFLLIDFLNALLNSNHCPNHSLSQFQDLYQILYTDLQCYLSINMKNSIYNLLITMIVNHPLEWKNKCKSISETLFVLLLSLITIEIKVYYDDIERINLNENKSNHQQYDDKCIEIINHNIRKYLHFIEFCISELIDEESTLHLTDSDIALIQSKLLDISSFIIEYLKKIFELNKENDEHLINYTIYSIKLIGLFMKECYTNLIPSIYDILPNLFSRTVVDKSKENTINECTKIYLLPSLFNIIDDENSLKLFLNNNGIKELSELIKYFYHKYLMYYSIESEAAISELYLIMSILNDLKDRGVDYSDNIDYSLFFSILQSLIKLYEEDECLINCLFGYILLYIFEEISKDKMKMNSDEKNILQSSMKIFQNKLKNDCDDMLVSKYEEDESKIHELLGRILEN